MAESLKKLKELFDLKDADLRTYSPLTLAYIGDGVYDIDRENQIPRAEKHAEKHACNVDIFAFAETFFHGIAVPLLNLSIRMAADGSRKLTYMVTSRRAKGNINYLMWALLNVIKRKDICIGGGCLILLTQRKQYWRRFPRSIISEITE